MHFLFYFIKEMGSGDIIELGERHYVHTRCKGVTSNWEEKVGLRVLCAMLVLSQFGEPMVTRSSYAGGKKSLSLLLKKIYNFSSCWLIMSRVVYRVTFTIIGLPKTIMCCQFALSCFHLDTPPWDCFLRKKTITKGSMYWHGKQMNISDY